ncbi:hypothetical protein FEM48_Zijuj05G0134500 [Ziziphus jujuba var. spinosa]|uniref:R13L1/DRL21-like LRR repeat region domain-containing protein n=1 Tax=Ziziphus jujuba var. spinosa TaxID=714518 RepID=A0A978VF36_ZIZJJ|nr:hypothetical protein FEM48_Zijuj05G0134500 [Ziziphus jujuba var. spinosa]
MVDGCEDLVPHPNIKVLKLIAPYVGVGLLNCISSLHNLVEFELWGHKECRYVAALSHLPNLKVVHIRNLPVVEYISMEKYDNIVEGSSSPFFPSLQSLWLDDMPNLKGWWKVDDDVDVENKRTLPFFPCLSQLSISDCPDLTSMPPFPFLQESLHLEDTSIKVLQETLMLETNAICKMHRISVHCFPHAYYAHLAAFQAHFYAELRWGCTKHAGRRMASLNSTHLYFSQRDLFCVGDSF